MSESLIRLSRSGTHFCGEQGDVQSLRRRFEREHCLYLPGLLDPGLRPKLEGLLEQEEFHPHRYRQVGSELRLTHGVAWKFLHFLANYDAGLFDLIRQMTGCAHIGIFNGRVYGLLPDPEFSFDWHTDVNEEGRMVAMSVNLSPQPYAGGALELRDAITKQILFQAGPLEWGDALLFRIADALEHRVTPVEGTAAKTAFTGWFQAQPDFYACLRQRRAELETEGAVEVRR